MLLAAEKFACAAELQVEGGDFKAGAEVAELLERREAFAGDFREFRVGRDQQVGVGAAVGTADTAAKLVELGEPVALAVFDNHGVGQGDIEPIFYNCSA